MAHHTQEQQTLSLFIIYWLEGFVTAIHLSPHMYRTGVCGWVDRESSDWQE